MYPTARIASVNARDLAVEDPGTESGFPVIAHNGAGSRHLFASAVAEGQNQGFRLIGYDRPGCGGSTAMPGRLIADCAVDMQAIMTDLGIIRAAAWGSSGGGPYALATAAKLPAAVTAVRIPNVTTHFPADQDHTNVERDNQAAALAWLAMYT